MATGIFVDTTTQLVNAINALGLVAVQDSRNARPLTVFVEPPTFDAFNYNVGDITYVIRVLAAPPGNQDASDYLLTTVDTIMDSDIVITSGRPTVAVIGSQEIPAYDLTVRMSAQRS